MQPNEEGALAPAHGYLAERMLAMPEFKRAETPACTLVEMLPLIDSSDMGPEDWLRIADVIERLYYEFDGFVIVMGTDTMAYAASALSFILECLGKTVVLTGSMLPLSVLFNDAHRNLIVSIVLAATLDVPEVCIFMDHQLMRGNRTVKSNNSGLDAFESPNFPALAKLETGIRFRPNLVAPQPKGRFRVHRSMEKNIAVWRLIPGFDDEYIGIAIRNCTLLRAIVLELYGTGNLSARKASLVDALEAAVSKGIIIIATSQCHKGSVNLSTYALGRKLETIGVLSAFDMTTEAVVAKLGYILSWPDMNRAAVKQYMGRSLRGEVTANLSDSSSAGLGGPSIISQAIGQLNGRSQIAVGVNYQVGNPNGEYAAEDEIRMALPSARNSARGPKPSFNAVPASPGMSAAISAVTEGCSTLTSPSKLSQSSEETLTSPQRSSLAAAAAMDSAASLARAMTGLTMARSSSTESGGKEGAALRRGMQH